MTEYVPLNKNEEAATVNNVNNESSSLSSSPKQHLIREENNNITHHNAATSAKPPINNDNKKKMKNKKNKKEGGSGVFGIFKAALFMLRKKNGDKSSKKSITKQNSLPAANPNWTKLVDSMRPLHLQETPVSPPSTVSGEREVVVKTEDIMFAPPSPAASSSTTGTMSKYASAQSLRDLYNSSDNEDEDEEEEDPDAMFDALCGDEMIDFKAEEFIARFYTQIKQQNSAAHRHYQPHHHRGGTI